jgi:dynactin-4
MNTKDTAYVLYVDHQGHPAPLSLSYHAIASRRLASAVDHHPPSTLTEVDSAYCPQCLAFHDVNTASTIGYCPKPTCRQCPLCQSIASVTVDEAECLFRCGKCDWTSRECHLFASTTLGADGAVLKEDFDKAASELGEQLMTRMEQQDHRAEDHYKNMLKALEGMAKEQVKGQRTTTFFPSFAAANRRGMDGPEGWSVQALEDSIVARGKLVEASVAEIVGGQVVQVVSLEAEEGLDESLNGKSPKCVLLQGAGAAANSTQDILPLPIPLRPRKSRRCRAELAEGRPGILVKPKLNPLEGDSSLRTGHGQWWKKVSDMSKEEETFLWKVGICTDPKSLF